MKKILAVLLILCCALPATAKKRQNEEIITPLSQLEKRQFQTKTYPAADNLLAMKAILNVLQDEGFIVYNVNSLLGYIYGVKDFDTSDPNVDISKEFGLTKSRLNYNGVKVATLEVSVNVTEYGQQARIRANFKRKLFNEYGNAQMIDDIDEAEFYSDFYQKVDAAIKLQKEIAAKVKKEEIPAAVIKPVQKSRPVVKRPPQRPVPVVIQEKETVQKNEQEVQHSEQIPSQSAVSEPENTQKPEEKADIKTDITVKPSEIKEVKSEEVKQPEGELKQSAKETTPPVVKEQKPEPKAEAVSKTAEPTPEKILDLVPVDTEPEQVPTTKEEAKALKELVKQARAEAKQAQKEAWLAQKEAMQLQKDLNKEAQKAEKEALKEAKRQAKEMRE